MLDKIDRKLLALLQQDCTLSLQALAEAVNLTTTPCWKRLKRLEDDGILIGKVALLDPEKIGLGLTAFVLIKTQHHSSEWYCRFVTVVTEMPEVLGFWRDCRSGRRDASLWLHWCWRRVDYRRGSWSGGLVGRYHAQTLAAGG